MSETICTRCKGGHGSVPTMKETRIQNFKNGASQPEIVRFDCPYCGYGNGTINTHKEPITAGEIVTIVNTHFASPFDANNIVISGITS